MHEKDTSINEHLLKNRIIYSLTRKAALSKQGWQREGIEHLRGACLQNKENMYKIITLLRAGAWGIG